MSRNEPVIYVRIRDKVTSTKGVAPPLVHSLMSTIAKLEAENKAILDKGPPTESEAKVLAANNAKLATARRDLAAAKAVAPKASPTAVATPPANLDVSRAALSISFDENEKKSTKMTLTVENLDLRWFETPLFEKGTALIVSWGYVGNMKPPREMIVHKVKGGTTLQIECTDKGQLMNKEAKTRSWNNVTRAEVVRLIAAENGFGPEAQFVDDGPAGAAAPTTVASLQSTIATTQKAIQDILDLGPPSRENAVRIGQLRARKAKAEADLADARKAGVRPKSPGGIVRYATIAQAGQTDAAFLKRLADLQGFEFYLGADGLHWHPRRFADKPRLKLQYFTPPGVGDIVDFSVENDVTAKPSNVTVKGSDPLEKTTFAAAGSDASTPRPTLAPNPELAGRRQVVDPITGATTIRTVAAPGTLVQTTAEPNAAAAQTEAAGKFVRTQQTSVELELDLVGNPNLFCKQVVEIAGIGKRLSGRYYVSELTDSVSSNGFTQKAKVKTDGTNGSGSGGGAKTDSAAKPNTQTAPAPSTALTPRQVVDPVTGETKTIYVQPR